MQILNCEWVTSHTSYVKKTFLQADSKIKDFYLANRTSIYVVNVMNSIAKDFAKWKLGSRGIITEKQFRIWGYSIGLLALADLIAIYRYTEDSSPSKLNDPK